MQFPGWFMLTELIQQQVGPCNTPAPATCHSDPSASAPAAQRLRGRASASARLDPMSAPCWYQRPLTSLPEALRGAVRRPKGRLPHPNVFFLFYEVVRLKRTFLAFFCRNLLSADNLQQASEFRQDAMQVVVPKHVMEFSSRRNRPSGGQPERDSQY